MSPLKLPGPLTLGSFTGHNFETVSTVAIVRRLLVLDQNIFLEHFLHFCQAIPQDLRPYYWALLHATLPIVYYHSDF